ncbi:MAG: hypothetical protein U0805_21070 [Pirellulales bacterium]
MASRNYDIQQALIASVPGAIDGKVVRGPSSLAPGKVSYFTLTTAVRPEVWTMANEYASWTELLAALGLPTTTAPPPF